jgi:signal transduction histidine kinase/PAS domain-containing protein/AmiR/NasT family two-component response regulator
LEEKDMIELTRDRIIENGKMIPGSVGFYLVRNGAYETVYSSESIPALLGMSSGDYEKENGRNAINVICRQDRPAVLAALQKCVLDGTPIDIHYRVYHAERGFDWVHAKGALCGRLDGCPVLFFTFSNASEESDIYQDILDHANRMIYIVDCSSHEVLYANRAACASTSKTQRLNDGIPCYALLHGKEEPCEDCFMEKMKRGETLDLIRRSPRTGKWESLSGQFISWCGHDAFVQYIEDITESRLLQQELEQARRRYQIAVEGAGLGVWEYHIKEHTISSPSHSFRAFGVPDVIQDVPNSILPLFPEKDREKLKSMFQRLDAGEEKVVEDFWMKWKADIPLRCEHVVYTATKDENGEPDIAYGIGLNITAQEQARADYERLREQLTGNLADVIGSFQVNLTKNLYISGYSPYPNVVKSLERKTADEHFAATAQTVISDEIRRDILKDYTCRHLLELFRRGQKRLDRDYPVRTAAGGTMWIHSALHMMLNPGTGDVEGITYSNDVTSQKRNEEIIRLSISEGCDYIGIIDPDADTYERYSGTVSMNGIADGQKLPYGEVRARTALLYLLPQDSEALLAQTDIPVLLEALKSDRQYVVSYSFRSPDDASILYKQIRFSWLGSEKREILVLQQDITEAQNREREHADQLRLAMLEAEHANAMKTEFLSNVSHDMRTPLNAVLGYAALAAQAKSPEEAADYIAKISRAGNLLLTLINDTLDLTKIESGEITLKPAPIGCGEVIGRVLAAIRPEMEKKNIRFTLDNSRAVMATINIDALRVQEIFINLLSNAVKFTPEGGEIAMIVECVRLEPGCVHDRITVRDSGCGMSPGFLSKIFEPFAQERLKENTDVGGTGLGLSIVKRLVDLMGGSIEVHSELGKGSEFIVSLDFERVDDMDPGRKASAFPQASLDGLRVLLCEDNAMNREIAVKLLEFRGVAVECAENGEAGVRMYSESPSGKYIAVLMDLRMPVMGGIAAAKAIRGMDRPDAKSVPIIAMTADAFDDDVQECMAAGMNGHIAKPIDPEALYRALSAAVQKRLESEGTRQ